MIGTRLSFYTGPMAIFIFKNKNEEILINHTPPNMIIVDVVEKFIHEMLVMLRQKTFFKRKVTVTITVYGIKS